jgi:hypothetical protein
MMPAVSTMAPWQRLRAWVRHQALRMAAFLSAHALYMPVLNGLATVFSCPSGSEWMGTGVHCLGELHVLALVAGSLLLLAFVVAVIAGATTAAVSARAKHGRPPVTIMDKRARSRTHTR